MPDNILTTIEFRSTLTVQLFNLLPSTTWNDRRNSIAIAAILMIICPFELVYIFIGIILRGEKINEHN